MVLRSSPASLHGDPVDRGDDVAGLDAGVIGGRARHHPGHQRAARFGDAEFLGDVRRDGIDIDAEDAALDLAVLDQLVHDALDHVDRNGEADADIAAAARQNRGVDADQFAAQIDQRAAGIARIDRGVGLDEILVAESGLMPLRPSALTMPAVTVCCEAEGIADGDHVVADLELGRIAERHGDQVRLLGLQHGDIRALVAADDLGAETSGCRAA